MKILIVSDHFNKGGVSYVIYQLVKEWSKNHELSLLFFEKTSLAYEMIFVAMFMLNLSTLKL
ncbi:TPA: hypothetical protein RXK40_000357 [Campylobacter jejuni]|nr:hypothetical protein [Campylobacter jejuni]MCW1346714.1 hypothetical protein [Campylobacter jejuni]MCW1349114.1 hypothetical protein [Campylobacter jejuni]HEA7276098.1 hypothetical protein [Campylobacter jejuni]HEC1670963.1 hypothetical protein [Campylobacter jejuni]